MALFDELNGGQGGAINNTVTRTTQAGTVGSRGLFQNIVPTNAAGAGVPGMNNGNYAYTRGVQDDALVENRLNDLISSDSRYIQQARSGAARQAGRRGLLNSSIAAGNAEGEAIRSALPIASQDAMAIDAARRDSMGAENEGLMQTRDINHRILSDQLNAESAMAGANAAAANAAADRASRMQLQREGYAFEGEQRGLDRAHQINVMGYESTLQGQMRDDDTFRTDYLENNRSTREQYNAIQRDVLQSGLQDMSDIQRRLQETILLDPESMDQETWTRMNDIFRQTAQQNMDALMASLFGRGG